MSIQRYTNGKIGFGFGTDQEEVFTIFATCSGAGFDERGVRQLICANGKGNVRFVEEVTAHVDNGYCMPDTWKEVFPLAN